MLLFLKKSVFSTLKYVPAIRKNPKPSPKTYKQTNKQKFKKLVSLFFPPMMQFCNISPRKNCQREWHQKKRFFGPQGNAGSFNTRWWHFSFSSLEKTCFPLYYLKTRSLPRNTCPLSNWPELVKAVMKPFLQQLCCWVHWSQVLLVSTNTALWNFTPRTPQKWL